MGQAVGSGETIAGCHGETLVVCHGETLTRWREAVTTVTTGTSGTTVATGLGFLVMVSL